jgi:phosphoribosylformimino-5-aminoimidazole carboxamide ribotide isomerase
LSPVVDSLVRVIPVLDLMGGEVVRAQRGERASYRPIVTPLAGGSDPVDIARALLARCPVPASAAPLPDASAAPLPDASAAPLPDASAAPLPDASAAPLPDAAETPLLYVADLDALTGRPPQLEAIRRLLDALPSLVLWLDAGFDGPEQAAQVRTALGPRRVRPVIASESLADVRALDALAADEHAILSLDSRLSTPMDPAGVWERPDLWPSTVIVMTLDRVGANAGPDVDALAVLAARAPHVRRWVGAGGLRHAFDLATAARAGAHAWLVASALHDGTLDPRTIDPSIGR